jgi:predicted dehydrogenase
VSLRAAVVGTSFGARIHVPAFRSAGFEVVALVGQDPTRTARRAQRLGIDHACTSLADALDVGVDAVSIAGPPATHAGLAAQAIEAGCHVLCEKPFTLDAPEAQHLVRAADDADVVGYLGHEFRWSPEQALIEWALESGLIGTPKLMLGASFLSMLRSFPMADWWYDPAAGGGWFGASGSHRIDALCQWFGEVEAVSAGLPAVSDPALAVDDSFDMRCVMRSGVDVSLMQSAAAIGPAFSTNRIVGTGGTLWSEADGVRIADADNPEGRRLDPPDFLALPDVEDLAVGPLADMTRTELPPYIMLTRAFRRAIEGEPPGPGPRPATFADGLACMQVVDAVRQSAAAGGSWITLEPGGPT